MLGRGARELKVEDGGAAREGRRDRPDAERRVAAWIGPSIVIDGQVTSSEDMTIAGRVKGDVEVRDSVVVIAPEAHIDGKVIALDVVVHGRVTGDIVARRKVDIGATGAVAGDIATPSMTVAEGATLNGRLSITPGERTLRA